MTNIDKTVLILEDSPAIANLLAHYLEETYKFKCKLFDTFQEAKDYFADHNHIRPVAAVVDLHLPDCTPEEAVKLTVAENIPTIVFTGNVSNSVRDLILQHGITDYVLKSTPNGIAHIGKMIKRLEANKEVDVLVVDDAPSMRKMIRTLLESQCFRVFETNSGKEAIEIVTSTPKIRIVVVDYFVQDMTGADLVLNLRNRYPIEKLGIIGMSAYGSHHMSADMIKYGADDFIIKPFLPEEFICRVNSMATHLEEFYFLQKLNVEKNNILGMIAHDVRGPLGAIDGACQLLLGKDYDKEKQHYFLNKIRTIIKDQLMLLSDLLDTTAIEEGRLSIDLNLNNLIELAKSRVEYFQIVASGKQIHIQLQVIDDIPSFLFDRNRLKQVVDNLISNAIKYSPPNQPLLFP